MQHTVFPAYPIDIEVNMYNNFELLVVRSLYSLAKAIETLDTTPRTMKILTPTLKELARFERDLLQLRKDFEDSH